jgi:hypothetical protein
MLRELAVDLCILVDAQTIEWGGLGEVVERFAAFGMNFIR